MTLNVLLATDQNILDAVDEARDKAAEYLARYVETMRELADLEAMAQLRKAMGAELTPIKITQTFERLCVNLETAK